MVFDSKNNFQSLGRGNLDKIIRHKKGEKLKLEGENAKIQDGVSIEDIERERGERRLTGQTAKQFI